MPTNRRCFPVRSLCPRARSLLKVQVLRGWSPRRARRTQRRRRHPSSWKRGQGVLRDLLRAVDSARDLRPDSLRVTRRFHSRRGLLRCREALETVLDVVEHILHKTTIIGSFAFARPAILAFNALELNEVGGRGCGNKTTPYFSTSSLDGHISTDLSTARLDDKCDEWSTTGTLCFVQSPSRSRKLLNASLGAEYFSIPHQDCSAWMCEMVCRATHEPWET
ncbi:hypothetical protein EXIGLDRAFT_839083 [Exidia glandulosa HHB12029]|uniref:Uncharacterized protein n=1 Tax=Exidia glandulosa HHB12029 TaxID=1314781 RepID=A0A165F995_EXIGL|nr:hypothetical protein EXIGLDRAFT_839083 [Exidia glandulosa HHB12029]